MGGLATSIREMGPHARQFTLDDHWSGWNHGKRISLGETISLRDRRICLTLISTGSTLASWMEEAISMRAKQAGCLDELTATFPKETTARWLADVKKWVNDKQNSEDPYEDRAQGKCSFRRMDER